MRLMGIDYGSERVGIALTDDGGAMAFPHATLKNSDTLIEDIVNLIKKEDVGTVVVGLSKDRDGTDNVIQGAIDVCVAKLKEKTDVPIVFELEYYSTKESLHIQGKTRNTDASAATIILNSYINRMKRTS